VLPGADLMPFAIAALVCPVAACLAALPWAIPLALEDGHLSGQVLFSSLLVFSLGDMLGILVLAPPILWLLQKQLRGSPARAFGGRGPEALAVLVVSLALVLLLRWLGYDLQLAPLVVAVGWIGLRAGRVAAWVAVLLISLISLPLTMAAASDVERVIDHLLLLLIIAAGYLAGSYADAQALAAAEISRRDRLLYHADRLKTLRAMSVAVIHELSQPLSTISLETQGLLATTSHSTFDISEVREMAELIARKSNDLAELITRLRQFGERGDETMSLVSASVILDGAVQVAAGELHSLGVTLKNNTGADAHVLGSEIELRQALLNLLRNGMAAASCSNRQLQVGWTTDGGEISFFVENEISGSKQTSHGMGIGLIIARTIARAHGGSISFSRPTAAKIVTTLALPIALP
jgi:signal transduction histidine kinase